MHGKNEIPRYLRIADVLRVRLRLLPFGAPFETEQSLTEEFGVSRGTIRQSLDILMREGLLTREQGRGSFRSKPSDSEYTLRLESELTTSIREIHLKSKLSNLSITLIPAPSAVADILQIPHGTKVRKVTRVRIVDDEPFVFCTAYLRTDKVPGFYKRDYHTSLGELVRDTLKVHIHERHCDFLAAEADETVASALMIPVGTPVLTVNLFCKGYDGEPLLTDTFCFPSSQSLHFVV